MKIRSIHTGIHETHREAVSAVPGWDSARAIADLQVCLVGVSHRSARRRRGVFREPRSFAPDTAETGDRSS